MTDQTTPDPGPERERPVSACSGELGGLLARWAKMAPDECRAELDQHDDLYAYVLPELGYRDVLCSEGAQDVEADAALVLGAVVHHAARRGVALDLRTKASGEYRVKVWVEAFDRSSGIHRAGHYAPPPDALAGLASDALAAYLDVLEAA